MKTVPIIAPDKSVRLVPREQAPQAVKAGGRIALLLNDHKGKTRWVPLDAVHSALLHGGGSFPNEEQKPAAQAQDGSQQLPASAKGNEGQGAEGEDQTGEDQSIGHAPSVDVGVAASQIAQKWGGRVKA